MAKAFPLLTVDADGPVTANMALTLHIRLAEMLRYERFVADPAKVAELHEMRIAAKRLRYTMELLLPYAPAASRKAMAGLLDRTKKVQELIGEIHDRDVRIPLLEEYAARRAAERPEVVIGLSRLARRERGERDRLHAALARHWSEQRERYISRFAALIGDLALPSERSELPGER